MTESARILRDRLGLKNFKYVLIARVLATSYNIYLIFFNSRYPSTPLTSANVLRTPMPSMLYFAPFNSRPPIGPVFSLDDYAGVISNSLFFVIDMAGIMGNEGLRSRVIETYFKNGHTHFHNEPFEIYKNPSFSEINDSDSFCRGILTKDGDFYIASNSSAIHYDIAERTFGPHVYVYNDYDIGICFQRDGNTNNFWLGESIERSDIVNPKLKELFEEYTKKYYSKNGRNINFVYKKINEMFTIYGKNLKVLEEGLTIKDLKDNATSDLNRKFYKLRRSEGNSGSELKDVKWDQDEDTVLLTFEVTPTYESGKVLNYSPDGAAYTSNSYTCQILFMDASKYIGDYSTFVSFEKKEQGRLVLQMIDEAEVKLFSSDPSFIFQSSMEYLDQVGASIYPFWSKSGKDVWAKRHTGTLISGLHITKHIKEMLSYIRANYAVIAKKLREQ